MISEHKCGFSWWIQSLSYLKKVNLFPFMVVTGKAYVRSRDYIWPKPQNASIIMFICLHDVHWRTDREAKRQSLRSELLNWNLIHKSVSNQQPATDSSLWNRGLPPPPFGGLTAGLSGLVVGPVNTNASWEPIIIYTINKADGLKSMWAKAHLWAQQQCYTSMLCADSTMLALSHTHSSQSARLNINDWVQTESTADSSKQAGEGQPARAQMNSLHTLSPLLRRKGNAPQYSPLLLLTKLEWLMGMIHVFTWIDSVSQIESIGICDIKKKILQTL